jgi:hypothetical protein
MGLDTKTDWQTFRRSKHNFDNSWWELRARRESEWIGMVSDAVNFRHGSVVAIIIAVMD